MATSTWISWATTWQTTSEFDKDGRGSLVLAVLHVAKSHSRAFLVGWDVSWLSRDPDSSGEAWIRCKRLILKLSKVLLAMEVKGPYMHANQRLILIQKWCDTRDIQLIWDHLELILPSVWIKGVTVVCYQHQFTKQHFRSITFALILPSFYSACICFCPFALHFVGNCFLFWFALGRWPHLSNKSIARASLCLDLFWEWHCWHALLKLRSISL